jgi:hypothetical protein
MTVNFRLLGFSTKKIIRVARVLVTCSGRRRRAAARRLIALAWGAFPGGTQQLRRFPSGKLAWSRDRKRGSWGHNFVTLRVGFFARADMGLSASGIAPCAGASSQVRARAGLRAPLEPA